MKCVKNLSLKGREKLIERYSYFFNDSENFVEENLQNYIEMDYILENIVKNIEPMKNEYNIHYFKEECHLSFENKKTKERYHINIEF